MAIIWPVGAGSPRYLSPTNNLNKPAPTQPIALSLPKISPFLTVYLSSASVKIPKGQTHEEFGGDLGDAA